MSFTFLLAALRARYRLFGTIVLSTVIATLAVSLIVSKTYVARASVLVDGKYAQSMSTNLPWQDRDRLGYLQTQVDILTSPKVAGRVIKDLKLNEDPELNKQFQGSGSTGSFNEWMTERLIRPLKIDTSESSIIHLTFSAADPVFAARIANGFSKAYIDTVLEMRVEPLRETSAWFDEQLKGLRDNIEQAQKRLTDFQQHNGIVANDENFDLENIQLADLARQVAGSRGSADGFRSFDAASAESEYSAGPRTNPSIENLKSNLIRAEAKLHELSGELGVRHPHYQRQKAELDSLRDRMRTEMRLLATGSEQAMRKEQQRKERLVAAMAAQRERVLSLKQARNQIGALSNDVAIAQRTYDNAMQRFMASKIESRARISNVSLFNEALPPTKPSRPRLTLNLAVALAIGALLGLAAVHLTEISDHRVRLIDDLDGDPNTPLLAVLNARDADAGRYLANPITPLHALPRPS